MLCGCIRALDTLSFDLLREVLLPMLNSIWVNLCQKAVKMYADVEIIENFCELV